VSVFIEEPATPPTRPFVVHFYIIQKKKYKNKIRDSYIHLKREILKNTYKEYVDRWKKKGGHHNTITTRIRHAHLFYPEYMHSIEIYLFLVYFLLCNIIFYLSVSFHHHVQGNNFFLSFLKIQRLFFVVAARRSRDRQ
jgi:hypothetical protein